MTRQALKIRVESLICQSSGLLLRWLSGSAWRTALVLLLLLLQFAQQLLRSLDHGLALLLIRLIRLRLLFLRLLNHRSWRFARSLVGVLALLNIRDCLQRLVRLLIRLLWRRSGFGTAGSRG